MILQQKKEGASIRRTQIDAQKELMALAVHGFGIKNNASVRFTQRDAPWGWAFSSSPNGTER